MKRIKYIFKLFLLVVVISSCNKDLLITEPLGEYSETTVWKDPALAQTFVNKFYRNLGIAYKIGMQACFIDEAHFTPDWGISDFNKGLLTPDQIPGWNDQMGGVLPPVLWNSEYKNIRATNIFFSKIDGVEFDNTLTDGKTMKDRLTGEAYFMRAYYYHRLTSLYGGVPIITKPYGLKDDFLTARNTWEECINFIVQDLDKAIALLPAMQSGKNKGRVTKGAAMAMKARVLLYAASDLHNNNAMFSGFSNRALLGYTSGDPKARWTAAKNAAKAVMDLGTYDLYLKNGTPETATQNIINLFTSKGTQEDIFISYFISKMDEDWGGYNPGIYCGPNGWHNWGNNCPLQELVDDYEMADGTRFDWNNPVHVANPYANRDPRFYATVLYDGSLWRKRPVDMLGLDPIGIVQTGSFEKEDGSIKGGLDTRDGPIESWNGGYTGYYVRKFIDPTIDAQYFKQEVPWRFIRYGEILLNYAEACIELGEDVEARRVINLIRKRAGMPDITESGASLKVRYRNERRIEMAYEEQRFFDVRRWAICDQVYKPVHGIKPLHKFNSTQVIYSKIVVEPRAWDNKAYFFPIFRDEMNKNTLLVQNPGY